MDGDAGPARLRLLVEDLVVDHVDGSKVVHVRQEDVHLDDIVDAASGGLENGSQVGQRLGLRWLIS